MESQDKASSLDIFYFRSIDLAGTHIKKKKKNVAWSLSLSIFYEIKPSKAIWYGFLYRSIRRYKYPRKDRYRDIATRLHFSEYRNETRWDSLARISAIAIVSWFCVTKRLSARIITVPDFYRMHYDVYEIISGKLGHPLACYRAQCAIDYLRLWMHGWWCSAWDRQVDIVECHNK